MSITSTEPARLLSREQAPAYVRRDYIHSRYLVGGSYREAALGTLLSLTNETLNAWTTICGFLGITSLYIYSMVRLPHGAAPFTLFYLSALLHNPVSIACSCFIGVSDAARAFWRMLDVMLIFTCAVPRGTALAWFVFAGQPLLFATYLLALALNYVYCVASTAIYRRVREIPRRQLVWDIACVSLGYTAPLAWQAARELWTSGAAGLAGETLAGVAACLGLSAYVCTQHVPERWSPGRYDLVGQSHQVMHVLVVAEYVLEFLFVARMAANAPTS